MKLNLKSLVLFAALASAFASSAQALTIRLFTKVAGYNGGDWIEIVDGAPKAKPANMNGKWVTDRVSRGEPLLVKVADKVPGGGWDVDLVNATITVNGKQVSRAERWIPDQGSFNVRVIDKPSADNVVINIKSVLDNDRATRRIPIGTR